MGQYAYLWEFQARAGRQEEFERHYGPDGAWVTLFRKAPGYIETLLLRDRSQELRLCRELTTHETSLAEFTD